ncbi:MAG TPA: class I SAM-dependent methyltransferase [Actinocrinis sp.]|nr:class I SAM-dependent methyltransferase [Actinocrinis sp.]
MDTAAVRAKSFGAAAQDYDRYRVGPPSAIVAEVTPAHCEAVLDLGAGTGALTRHLVGRFPAVFAVEPDQRMRDVLTESCPGAVALDGVAEKIPLPDASVDAVLVSSAWHWMDPALAIPEIARVLRPGGMLGIIWNRRDTTVPWVADLEDFRRSATDNDDSVGTAIRYYLEEDWLPAGAPLRDIEISALPWHADLTRDDICGLLATFTGYLLATPEEQAEIMRKFRDYVHGDARLGTGETVRVPMLCHYWRAVLA